MGGSSKIDLSRGGGQQLPDASHSEDADTTGPPSSMRLSCHRAAPQNIELGAKLEEILAGNYGYCNDNENASQHAPENATALIKQELLDEQNRRSELLKEKNQLEIQYLSNVTALNEQIESL